MNQENAIKLFKCLADKSRIQILCSLMEEEMYVERLAERLGLTAPTISFHLKKLEEAGIVAKRKDQYYTMFSVNREILHLPMIELLKEEASEEEKIRIREEQYRKKVIDSFFEYGKLKSIPAQRKKEKICLEEIAKSFDIGRDYSEREVNLIIADYNDDFCTIRRDMIGFGILTREQNTYCRVE